MRDNEMIGMNNLTVENAPSIHPLYEPIMRQNQKLGRVATKAFHEIGRLLMPHHTLTRQRDLIGRLRQISQASLHMNVGKTPSTLRAEVRKSHQLLAIAKTVFPLTLFPDSVVVDRTKVTIIHRTFFWSAETISFQIDDILNVSASVGPFFGSLTIASRVMSTVDHFYVNYLWRRDAVALKHIIQGYIIAKHNDMNTDHLSPGELVAMLSELGIDSDR
jgi:hypothetical protein